MWTFLSYILSDRLTAYKNGNKISIEHVRQIANGDLCNNTSFTMSSHFGTHIDFPHHFIEEGKIAEDYPADFFISNKVEFLNLAKIVNKPLISIKDFENRLISKYVEMLILKTGYTNLRYQDCYWNDNLGFDLGVAKYLKDRYPLLKFIGFDFMSISCVHHRQLGRVVHKEFLSRDILPIEDMDLSMLREDSIIHEIIISPLRIKDAEASPVIVFAKIK